jgi:hypothetical protein
MTASRLPPWLGLSLLVSLMPGIPAPASAQVTQLQVNRLEQEVRDLRRELDLQRRRLEDLERMTTRGPAGPGTGAARPRTPAGTPAASTGTARAGEAQWLASANWEQVRPGLAELEVVALLGPPTSMRVADDGRRRILLYALEIGSSGYLAGNVVLEDGRVVTVEHPRLR